MTFLQRWYDMNLKMDAMMQYLFLLEEKRKLWLFVKLLWLVAEAEAGYLSGPAGLGGKIYGITSLVIIPAYNL